MSEVEKGRCSARPRCSDTARASILEAAKGEFTRESYDQVGLRKIASEAGYDKALVHRYFGSKEELFREVLSCVDHPVLAGASSREVAEALADRALRTTPEEGPLSALLLMLRSISSPVASEIAYQGLEEHGVASLAGALDGEDARLRAGLGIAVVVGTVLLAKVVGSSALTDAEPEQLRARLVAVLEAALA